MALAVLSFCYLSLEPLSLLPGKFLLFIFFASIFTYTYMRIVQNAAYSGLGRTNLKNWFYRKSNLNFFYALTCGVIAIYYFRQIYQPGLIRVMILPTIISLSYPITFPRAFSNFTSLRLLPGLKLFLIAFTWAYLTVLVPNFLYSDYSVSTYMEFAFRILLIMSLVIPFDIRDMNHDDEEMQTLPQRVGYKSARHLAMFGIFIYQLWLMARVIFFDYNLISALAQLFAFEAGYWLIRFSNPQRRDSYYSFWLEAVPIFAAGGVILFQGLIPGRG